MRKGRDGENGMEWEKIGKQAGAEVCQAQQSLS